MRFRVSLALLALALPAAAQTKPLITPKDFGKWELLGASRLSPRGDWVAYNLNRVNEENELRIQGGSRDTTIVVPFASGAVFSTDGKWVAYSIGVSPKERERLTAAKRPIRNNLEIRGLTTNAVTPVNEISGFSFSPDGRFISMTRYPAEGKRTSEVVVQDLSTGARLTFSNVGEQSWADRGATLALTIETEGGIGNGVQLYDASTGSIRALESSSASQYRQLAWRAKSMDLAVLRTRPEKEFKDTAHVLIAWTNVLSAEPAQIRLDEKTTGFPSGFRIADYRRPSWSSDGRTIYFGIRARDAVADALKKGDEKPSDVEIWHTNDVRMFPQQKSQENADLRRTLLTAWRTSEGRVVPIGTNYYETATALEGDRFATETDRSAYAWGQKFGRFDSDIWVIDLQTGRRTKVLEKVRHYFGASPSGDKLTWSDGKDY